jgi:hypothetical protein
MKKTFNLLFILIAILFISSCATTQHVQDCLSETPYGFFGGLWHGLIAPLAFLGHLFFNSIAIYAVNNNGGWYDFGFLLGISGWFSAGSSKK